MEIEQERQYVLSELRKSAEEIARGELISSEELDADLDVMFAEWEKEESKAGE